LLHCDWIWLRIHKLWLPEVRAKLVRYWGGDTHHCLLLLNSSNILLGFWAPFGAMSSSVILTVEVWISWVVVCEFQGSSSPSPSPRCKSSSCAWSVVLIGLRIFHIVDVSQILGLRSPRHFSIALSCFVRSATLLLWSSSDKMYSSSSWKSSSIVLGFFHVKCEAVEPGVRPLISALIVVFSSASGI
jgi:hypothetical protein